jgi:signal transduction histidine kinase/DNA-binding response OmpR family regulator
MNKLAWSWNTLAGKLIIGFLIVLGLSIGVNIFAIFQLQQVQNVAIEISENWMPSINTLGQIKNRTADYMISQQQHIFSLSEQEMAKYEQKMMDDSVGIAFGEQDYMALLQDRITKYNNQEESYNEDKVNFEAYQSEYDHFLLASRAVIDISSVNDKEDAKEEMLVNSFGSFEASINELDLLIFTNNAKAQQAAQNSSEIYTSASRLIVGMSLLSFIAGVIVAFFIVRSLRKQIGGEPLEIAKITHKVAQGDLSMHFEGKQTGIYASVGSMVKNMREINQITNKIAEGSLTQSLKIRSDKDQLAISINQMIDNFKDIINKAKVIAKGDYSIDIEQRGEQDELGSALRQMTLSLRQNKKDTDEQNWIKDGVSRLSQALSGNISLTELSQTAISFLARYTDSAQGALYIYDEKEEVLNLYGSFAFTERNTLSNKFKKGEGIIGQVGLEGNPILLKNIHRQDLSISTGTISEPPLNSYCLPLVFENELYGVYELSSFETFTDLKKEFLNQASLRVVTYLYSVMQTEKIRGLLSVSEAATLNAQTRAHEIEEVNSQLEEQRKQLETQSDELQTRNGSLTQAKEELDRRAEELEMSNKYKSEFLANMSHELRTPLNSIIMLSKMLSKNDKESLSEKDVKKSQIIYKSGQELLRLINDILDLSKVEAGKMAVNATKFTTHELLEDMHDMFHDMAEEKKLKFQVVDTMKTEFFTDRDRLVQVIRNFLSNALKFTKKGGITIKASADTKKNNHVRLSVIDTGIGILPEKQQVIFEAFKQADGTTSREFGGTGLGLSIARELTKLLQGTIELESKYGKGSTFSLVIPLHIDESLLDSEGVPLVNQDQVNKYKTFTSLMDTNKQAKKEIPINKVIVKAQDDRNSIIKGDKIMLIVEDELQFAESMAEIIRNETVKVLIAQTCQEGIALAIEYQPQGIILDLGLPDGQGESVLKKFKATPEIRHIPIEIVSAQDKDSKFMNLGARGFLQKPIEEKALLRVINELKQFSEKKVKELLILEDDNLQLENIKTLLAGDDIRLKGVNTKAQALEEIKKGHYDAAIVDLSLQDGTGEEVCDYIKQYHPSVSVIVYTARTLDAKEERHLRQAVRSIVPKSHDAEETLKNEVSLYLHRMEKEVEKESRKTSLVEVVKPKNTKLSEKKKPIQKKVELETTNSTEDTKPNKSVKQPQIPAIDEAEASKIIKGKTILVVDDDIRNIFVIASALENFEATILESLDGQEALEILEEEKIDLIMMDAVMPEMNGLEVIQTIRKNDKIKHLPIIAITGKAQKEDEIECLQAGANAYIVKPVNYDELLTKVCYWMKKGEK